MDGDPSSLPLLSPMTILGSQLPRLLVPVRRERMRKEKRPADGKTDTGYSLL